MPAERRPLAGRLRRHRSVSRRLASEWDAFLDFVVNRINSVNGLRYKNDATIAVISIAGEPQPPASEECGKARRPPD